MMKRLSVLTLLLTLLILMIGCDNGSVSESAASDTSGLVKVCLTVGDSSSAQKSSAIDGSYWTSLTYQYNAVPQWTDPQGAPIYGAVGWTTINYSAGMSLGYFTPGQWVFGIRIKDGDNVIYEGFSDIINVKNTAVEVDVLVNKLVTNAVAGSVRIAITAPSAQDDTLTISYTGDATGGPYTVTAESASDNYPFEYTVTGLSAGTYNFTLTHSAGGGDDIEVVLPSGEMAVISGYLNNGTWQLGYNTVKVFSVVATSTGSGSVPVNTSYAAVGDRVSFYVKPSNVSRLNSLSVTSGGNAVSYTTNGNLYSFIMPEGNVNISATFEDADTEININNFRVIVQSMYDSNPGVTAFGRSDTAPAGAEYLGIKDVLIWYDSSNTKICWYSENGNTFKFKAGSMANFFKDCDAYLSISMEGMDTSAVTSMASMFDGCSALISVDLTGLKTGNVTNMSKMFFGCKGLTSLVLDTEKVNGKFVNFNTSKVTDMSYMFSSADIAGSDPANKKMNIQSLDVSGLDTSKVTNMSHMFYLCSNSNFKTLDVSGFRTSNVTDMSSMFAGLYHAQMNYFEEIDMRGWDFTNVKTVNRMFDRCENANILLPNYTKLSKIQDVLYWFSHCFQLTGAKLQAFIAGWDFSGHEDKAALQNLFSKIASGNDESVPNNRIIGNDMNQNNKPADFGTRFTCPTYSSDEPGYENPITVLYVGGSIGSNVAYQRLTTVLDPANP